MSRKNLLNLIQVEPDAQPSPNENKIVKQVANQVREEKARQARADDIEKRLVEGQAVIELDAGSIDPSFVQDRMEGEIDGLRDSIRDQGQQVPILVRPHPDHPGRYQVAFGHRRLRAVAELGVAVRAIVRDLTDEQLVIAQGQENNERRDLSFIEKARFAARLRQQFPRDVIISSMSLDKGNLSKMLSIVDAIPASVVDAIGAAPGIGSPNWQQMVALFENADPLDDLVAFARSPEVQALPSAERFKAILALRPRRMSRGAPDVLSTPDGERLAQVKDSKAKVEITIDKRAMPDFAAFVIERLPGLYAEHIAEHKRQKEA